MDLKSITTDTGHVAHPASYHDTLILGLSWSEELKFLKMKGQQLVLERTMKLLSATFYVFESLDMKQPVFVIVNRNSFSLYDWNGNQLAIGNLVSYERFIVWKKYYFLNKKLQILRLKPSESTLSKYPYEVEWITSQNHPKVDGEYHYCIGEHTLVSVQRKYQDHEYITAISYFVWNDVKEEFELDPTFELEQPKRRSANSDSITELYSIQNRIVVEKKNSAARKAHEFGKYVCVYTEDGKLENRFGIDGNTSTFAWNNNLAEIQSYEDFSIIRFRNLKGEILQSHQFAKAYHYYVWNRNLVLFQYKITNVLGSKLEGNESKSAVNFWKTERLLWLASAKNRESSPFGMLPRELIRAIIGLIRENPAVPELEKKSAQKRKSKSELNAKRAKK